MLLYTKTHAGKRKQKKEWRVQDNTWLTYRNNIDMLWLDGFVIPFEIRIANQFETNMTKKLRRP